MKHPCLLASVLLVGCAALPVSPEVRAALDRIAYEPTPTCDLTTCPDKWALAQIWISNHSSKKIQLVTDAIIHTYATTGDSYAFSAAKLPLGNGEYRILISASCGIEKCIPNPEEMRHCFDHYLNTNEDVMMAPATQASSAAGSSRCPTGFSWQYGQCYPVTPLFGSPPAADPGERQ